MISFGSCIYPTLGSVKVSQSRVASPENYKHQTLKVSGVTPNYLKVIGGNSGQGVTPDTFAFDAYSFLEKQLCLAKLSQNQE